MITTRLGTAIAAVGIAAVGTLAPVTSAHAAARNGICENGEVCFFTGPNGTGYVSDFTGSVNNYGTYEPSCYDFKKRGGASTGICMKNHAVSVSNRTSHVLRVYFNSYYKGYVQPIGARETKNLDKKLVRQNASHEIGGLDCRYTKPSCG